MRVIALANQKGGVGKTTTAVNLAAGLAQLGHDTILIDCDPQANATTGVGYYEADMTDPLRESSYKLFTEKARLEDVSVDTQFPNLKLVRATKHLSGLEVELVDVDSREQRLKISIDSSKMRPEFAILDTPPSLGLITINCLVAADEVVIPVQCEFLSLAGIARLTETVKTIQSGPNPMLRVTGVVATMFDGRTNLAREVLDELGHHFPGLLFKTPIPRSVRLAEAPSYGVPVVEYAPDNPGAQAYIDLCKEVLAR
ncbi:MAG: ParA family protein [bacterium]